MTRRRSSSRRSPRVERQASASGRLFSLRLRYSVAANLHSPFSLTIAIDSGTEFDGSSGIGPPGSSGWKESTPTFTCALSPLSADVEDLDALQPGTGELDQRPQIVLA